MGMAIYNGQLLDIDFPPCCFKILLGLPVTLEDLCIYRPTLGAGLKELLLFDGDVDAAFGLNFTVFYYYLTTP